MEKDFRLDLKQGPYFHSYSRNGRDLLLGGQRGHVALFDWHKPRIKTELQLEERINDVCTLFDDSLFAVAQKKHLYMYDNNGIEIHCIRKHKFVHKLTYLPYHFLLCSIGKFGILKYIDISTGEDVSALNTKSGPCGVMQQNPWNAVIHLGHLNGSVTLWSPKTLKPLAKMLCHKAPVTSVNIDMLGRYLVTSGADNKIKVWDLRKFGLLHGHHKKVSKPNCVALSQKNMLAVAEGPRVSVYENIVVKKLDNQVKRALFPGHRITVFVF
ncbi:putative U3 small nucleolar RNA-associated protein 7, variant 2 [Bonamia ostreae]|uniref:U3 small nucleolar RNA-associated protein 7, variant 2 n=1 Tax=Bonamia ostreae TaxID=126728 RepID=A0ABV2AK71_9EUKA